MRGFVCDHSFGDRVLCELAKRRLPHCGASLGTLKGGVIDGEMKEIGEMELR